MRSDRIIEKMLDEQIPKEEGDNIADIIKAMDDRINRKLEEMDAKINGINKKGEMTDERGYIERKVDSRPGGKGVREGEELGDDCEVHTGGTEAGE